MYFRKYSDIGCNLFIVSKLNYQLNITYTIFLAGTVWGCWGICLLQLLSYYPQMLESGAFLANDFQLHHKAKQIVAGNLAGWASVTVGQPLDYLKVQLQVQKSKIQMFELYRSLGLRGLYKGASSIYMLIGVITAIQFFTFQTVCDGLIHRGWTDSSGKPTMLNLIVSGFFTGFFSSFIYNPIEYSKIRSQVSSVSGRGSVSRIVQILASEKLKGIPKLYTGLGLTLVKQSFGSSLYFGGYYIFLTKLLNFERENAPIWAQILSGAGAGVLFQLYTSPIDTIKTNVQSGKKTIKRMLAEKFWRQTNFKRSFNVSLLRSLLVDSTNFFMYQNARNMLIKSKGSPSRNP